MLDQPLKVAGLRPVWVEIAIHSAAKDYFQSLVGERELKILLKDRNYAVPAAGVLAIVRVNRRQSVADAGWIVVQPLLHHHGDHVFIQALAVLDGVHAGYDGVP